MIDVKSFPTTRYQGSKRKIVHWIEELTEKLEFETVLDAFGGSGAVSYLFKKMGKSVTYNDNLTFNYIIGKAIIQNQKVKFTEEDLENLYEWAVNNPNDRFIERTFDGVYYTKPENKWLDKVNHGILNMNHYTGKTLDYKKSLAYYALFQACLIKRPFNLFHRNNLSIRTNDVPRNFGNKTTWDKPFKMHFENFIEEVNTLVFNSKIPCFATNESVFDIENVNYDLVYLDPPYLNQEGTNETSNYLKCYHFLEGLANYDEWNDRIDHDSINLRFGNTNEQNEFKNENIFETFDTLIEKFSNSIIVLSYKQGGTPSIETLIKIMRRHKNHVYTHSIPYSYALNGQNGNKKSREVLIIGK